MTIAIGVTCNTNILKGRKGNNVEDDDDDDYGNNNNRVKSFNK